MKKWIVRIGIVLWLMCSVYTLCASFLPGPQGEQGERGYSVDLPALYKQVSPAVVWIGAEDEWSVYLLGECMVLIISVFVQQERFLNSPCRKHWPRWS